MKYTMTFPFEEYIITGVYYPATPYSYHYPQEESDFSVTSVTKDGQDIPLEVFFPDPETDDLMYDQLYDAICLKADEYDAEQQHLTDEADAKLKAELDALPPYVRTLEED